MLLMIAMGCCLFRVSLPLSFWDSFYAAWTSGIFDLMHVVHDPILVQNYTTRFTLFCGQDPPVLGVVIGRRARQS